LVGEEVDEELIQRRLEELERRRKQVCLRRANLSGMTLAEGDIIRIRIKGFAREEVVAVFICYNPSYNWIRLRLDDSEMIVKLSDVRYIRKELVKEEKRVDERKMREQGAADELH